MRDFSYVAGLICTFVGIIMILVYCICHNIDENGKVGKIIFAIGVFAGLSGASLLTVYYCVPPAQAPYVPTVMDYYLEFYKEENYTKFLPDTSRIAVHSVNHIQLTSYDFTEEETKYNVTSFKTSIIWIDQDAVDDGAIHELNILDAYCYTDNYSYQDITSYIITVDGFVDND